MKGIRGSLKYLVLGSIVALFIIVSMISFDVIDVRAQESRNPSAGIRLQLPVSAEIGKEYDQKVLNIYDAGLTHKLHYRCKWKAEKVLEDELPAGLEMTDDGRIKGTPNEAGSLLIWVEVTWEGSSQKYSTIDKASEDKLYNGYFDAIRFTIFDTNDTNLRQIDIGSNPEKIEVNKDFVLPAGEEKWYQFISPSNVVGFLLFQYSDTRFYIYDSKGYGMGIDLIDSSILVSPGETYYMHLKNATEEDATLKITSMAEGSTVDKYFSSKDNELKPFNGTVELKQENVTKIFDGDSNTNWDVYEISETYSFDYGILPNRYMLSWCSQAVVSPYQVHIDVKSDNNTKNPYINTFSVATDTLSGSFKKIVCPDNCKIQGKSIMSYLVSDEDCYGTSVFTFSVYVPHGKRLVDKNGVWFDVETVGGNPVADEKNPSSETDEQPADPGKVKMIAVKNKKSKAFSVSWEKGKNVTGYQIQYAKNKKFTKSKKNIFTKKNSYTVKKLSKKQTYYVRVRAYKLSGKTKVYGEWSGIKQVKIKK